MRDTAGFRACARASSEASGSSSSRRRGRISSARPTATRWRSPPDSLPGRRVEQRPMSSRSMMRSRFRRIVGEPAHAPAVVEIARDRQMRKQPAFLEHVADAAPVRRHVDAARAESNSTVSSSTMRPRSGVTSPAIMLTSEVLPAPEGPNSAVTPPARLEPRRQREFAEPLFHVDRQHLSLRGSACRRGAPAIRRRPARRAR